MGGFISTNENNDFGLALATEHRKLLSEELRNIQENPIIQRYFCFQRIEENEYNLSIYGCLLPQLPLYRDGAFKVRIIVTNRFPHEPPKVQLLTWLYHPNVHPDMSKPAFCCNCHLFKSQLARPISTVILHYVDTIDHPEYYLNCAHNPDASILYRRDRTAFENVVREMVTIYAEPPR